MNTDELTAREHAALQAIHNWLLHTGRSPSVRDLQSTLGYKSPRSAAVLIDRLIEKGLLARRQD
ncbi:MAG: repressor LexA, partial [Thermoanaerobaculia bacterium]